MFVSGMFENWKTLVHSNPDKMELSFFFPFFIFFFPVIAFSPVRKNTKYSAENMGVVHISAYKT